jgi:hypothetical protein
MSSLAPIESRYTGGRIGREIPRHRVKTALEALAGAGSVAGGGGSKPRIYWLTD